jgi:hypothetical protein
MIDIINNLQKVQQRIHRALAQYQRLPASITLLAVSKTQTPALITQLVTAGQRAFGENYVQEALPKISALSDKHIEWHFIGSIQTNKIQLLAQKFSWVHTVSRLKEADLLSKARDPALPPLNLCIQVKLDNSQKKSGVLPDQVRSLAATIRTLPNVRLRGLMGLPPIVEDFNEQRRYFGILRVLLSQLNKDGFDVDTLSMGMTHDLEAAIAEGATIVRIGTGIFGKRD